MDLQPSYDLIVKNVVKPFIFIYFYMSFSFARQTHNDILDNKRALAKMYRAAELCKHTLSKMDNAHCAVDSLHDGMDFNTKVSR